MNRNPKSYQPKSRRRSYTRKLHIILVGFTSDKDSVRAKIFRVLKKFSFNDIFELRTSDESKVINNIITKMEWNGVVRVSIYIPDDIQGKPMAKKVCEALQTSHAEGMQRELLSMIEESPSLQGKVDVRIIKDPAPKLNGQQKAPSKGVGDNGLHPTKEGVPEVLNQPVL